MFFPVILLLNHEYVRINLVDRLFTFIMKTSKTTYVHFLFDNHVLFFQKFVLVIDAIVQMYVST